jgi:hypothetical protein
MLLLRVYHGTTPTPFLQIYPQVQYCVKRLTKKRSVYREYCTLLKEVDLIINMNQTEMNPHT